MKDGFEVFILREDMKILIAEAFIDLLEKESIDKITVKQLIEECHISRQTFYYHFRDIMDVLEWASADLRWKRRSRVCGRKPTLTPSGFLLIS